MKGILPTSGAIFIVVIGILTLISGFLTYQFYYGSVPVFVDVSKFYHYSFISTEIKTFLQLASKYSFDQGAYEIMKVGGLTGLPAEKYIDGILLWRRYGEVNAPSLEDFKNSISNKYLVVFNEYVNQLKSGQSFITNKPEVDKTNIELISSGGTYPPPEPTVKIRTDNTPIQVGTSLTQYILINSSVGNDFNYLIRDIFDLAEDNFANNDKIKKAVEDGIAATGLKTSGSATGTCGGSCPTAEEVLGMSFDDAKELIRQKINEKLDGLEAELSDNVKVEFKDREIRSDVVPSCDDCPGVICDQWCCVRRREEFGGGCITYCYKYKKTLTCTFTYYGAVKVLVSVTDTKNEYMVYNSNEGKSIWNNVQLKFHVISGNKELI